VYMRCRQNSTPQNRFGGFSGSKVAPLSIRRKRRDLFSKT
jgi:hypothetical protein